MRKGVKAMAKNVEIDPISETETTGHEWDGIKELNTPLPRWWLWVLYLSIIWSVGYWIAMPSWPIGGDPGYTRGVLGHSQRLVVAEQIEANKVAQGAMLTRIAESDLDTIRTDADLLSFSLAGGRAAFGDNCAGCQGNAGGGAPGYPNLLDDAWIWGGSLESIHESIQYGIRSEHEDSRVNDMLAFGRDGILDREQIKQVVDYVLSLSGASDLEGIDAGRFVFEENCAACHGDDGTGIAELGGPNLADAIWLYGGDRASITESVVNGRKGVMPAWVDRLDPVLIKQLAVFVHSQGGGQ